MSLGVGNDSRTAQCTASRNLVVFWRVDTSLLPVLVLKCAVGSTAVSTGCLMSPSGLAWGPACLALWLTGSLLLNQLVQSKEQRGGAGADCAAKQNWPTAHNPSSPLCL